LNSESESRKAVAVRYTTQRAIKTVAREDVIVYSLRQKKEIEPHRISQSRTGAHGEKIWYLLPGRYFISRQDISGSGKHRCYNAWLIITDGKIVEEKTEEIPEFVDRLACECLYPPKPYQ
jgi:hypothetical protein